MSRAPGWLFTRPIAHRGLHDLARGLAENSMSAFLAAIEAGYAIELDVQMARGGEAMVFHDESLLRLTGEPGLVRHRTAGELSGLALAGTRDTVPTLGDVLAFVEGRVPLLVEVKAPTRRVGRLEQRVAELLMRYPGEAAVQSFNPWTLRWFREEAPLIPRGLLASACRNGESARLTPRARFVLRHLLTAPMSRPHFIAYDVHALPALAPGIARRLGLPLLAWTVRTEEEQAIGAAHADNIIFEGFRPPLRQGP